MKCDCRTHFLSGADTLNFHEGMPVHLDDLGGVWLYRKKWFLRWHRTKTAILWLARKLTWWRRPRHIVTLVDHELGLVQTARMTWSWRRWKWIVLALLLSCTSARQAEPAYAPTPWCFRLDLKSGDAGLACLGRRRTCEYARQNAISLAGVAGIRTVGDCGLERPQP